MTERFQIPPLEKGVRGISIIFFTEYHPSRSSSDICEMPLLDSARSDIYILFHRKKTLKKCIFN